jgi:hypothetical protein
VENYRTSGSDGSEPRNDNAASSLESLIRCWHGIGTKIKPQNCLLNQHLVKMISLFRTSRIFFTLMIAILLVFSGCKSKKKAMEAQAAAEKARMEQEAARQREADAEARRKREADEQARKDAEAKKQAPAQKLDLFFNSIANSNNVNGANNSINEALAMFSSPDTPVLIVISEENGQKDYDRPTTIRNYLNYLKDQKKNPNKISNLQFDSSGKITELELSKLK